MGVFAGHVVFGHSGMNVPVVVKFYDARVPSQAAASKQELAALASMKNFRSVVRLLGTCSEGLVLEQLPLDLRDLFLLRYKDNIHYLIDRPISTAANAKKFIAKVASELHAALCELHEAGWYHGDLSPRNVMWRLLTGNLGGVIRDLSDVELVLIDFGMSHKLTAAGPVNTGHTKPFGTKYFLTEAKYVRLTARNGDFFQALQLVIYLVLMMMNGGVAPAVITKDSTQGYQNLGSLWSAQNQPWLAFIVTHEEGVCKKLFHDMYCTPCRRFFAECMLEVARLDNLFSPPKHYN